MVAVAVGVGLVAGFMLFNQRYELSLAVLMVYLGLLDGYIKLKLNTSWATLGRDVLLYSIVGGFLIRAAVRRERITLPPLSGWVIAFCAIAVVQVFNPRGGWSLEALAAVRPHLEFVPLFFFGYVTMRTKRRLRAFLILLLVVTAVNAVVAYVQFDLAPQSLATWGPGYEARISGSGGVSGRYFVDDQGRERTRPFGLGSDQGFAGFLAMLAVPAAMALMLARKRVLPAIVFALLGFGVAVAVITAQARVVLVGSVIAAIAFALISSTARRMLPTAVGLVLALVVTMLSLSLFTSENQQAVFRKYDTVTPDRVVETTITYRRDTLARVPEYAARFPLGAGLGSGGPGAGFIAAPTTSLTLNAESEFTYLLIELGIAGLVLLLAFNVKLFTLALTRIRRLADLELRLLLGALLAPLFAVFATWIVGIATASTPGAPYFWFVAGIASYWLASPGGVPAPGVVDATAPRTVAPRPRPRPAPTGRDAKTVLIYRDSGEPIDGIRDHSHALADALQSQDEDASVFLVEAPGDVSRAPAAEAYVLQYNPFS